MEELPCTGNRCEERRGGGGEVRKRGYQLLPLMKKVLERSHLRHFEYRRYARSLGPFTPPFSNICIVPINQTRLAPFRMFFIPWYSLGSTRATKIYLRMVLCWISLTASAPINSRVLALECAAVARADVDRTLQQGKQRTSRIGNDFCGIMHVRSSRDRSDLF